MSTGEKSDPRRAAVDAAMALVGSLAGAPLLGPAMRPFSAPLIAEHDRRISVALLAAEQLSGLPREALAEKISADPRHVQALTRFLFAAGQNGHDEILRIIGASLVRNVEALEMGGSEDSLVEENMVLIALQDLTPLHVQVMTVIRDLNRPPEGMSQDETHVARESHVTALVDTSPRVSRFLLASLEANGLISHPNRYGDDEDSEFYGISELGELVLQAAAQVHARS